MAEKNYDAKSIKILEGLDAVRKRPGMYIGSTDKRGLHHLIWEIVDNSVDEAINGYGDYIKITLHSDKSCSIEDHGRGVPTDMHESGKSAAEVIYTVLHAGGKFESDGYKVSGGLHGVGSSVVNALSKWMEVTIKRDKKEHYIRFENGGHVKVPLKVVGPTRGTGTTVRFLPDPEIFSAINFSFTTVCERMQESAFLLKGITIEVVDEEDERSAKYHYERGIEEFVEDLNKAVVEYKSILDTKPIDRAHKKELKRQAESVLANVQQVFENFVKSNRADYDTNFLNAKFTIKNKIQDSPAVVGETKFKNYIGYMIDYGEDFIKKHKGESENIYFDKTSIEKFAKNSLGRKALTAFSMIAVTIGALSVIPKIYTWASGGVNPNASAIYNEASKAEAKEVK